MLRETTRLSVTRITIVMRVYQRLQTAIRALVVTRNDVEPRNDIQAVTSVATISYTFLHRITCGRVSSRVTLLRC